MTMFDWNEYWGMYQDWKYPVTVLVCFSIGYIFGFNKCKEKETEKRYKEIFNTNKVK